MDVPSLTIVNDIHWIDPTTLDLVKELVARVPKHRAMVVLTFRKDGGERSTTAFAKVPTLSLAPLTHEHMEQLVYHVAGRKYLFSADCHSDSREHRGAYRCLAKS